MVKTILWAVDIREKWGEAEEVATQLVTCFAKKENPKVELVYVADSLQSAKAAEDQFKNLFRERQLDIVGHPKVLISDGHTGHASTERARALIAYGVNVGADLIIAGTRGQGWFHRVLQGSFAQTLLQESPITFLTVGPGTGQRKLRFPSRILFPTHFGKMSRQAFRAVIQMASELGASITLYHWISNPFEPIFQSGALLFGGPFPVVTSTDTEAERERMKKKAECWTRWARGQGVGAEFIIDARGGEAFRAILDVAQRKDFCLIAMEAATPNTIVEQVMRESDCPVLMLKEGLPIQTRKAA